MISTSLDFFYNENTFRMTLVITLFKFLKQVKILILVTYLVIKYMSKIHLAKLNLFSNHGDFNQAISNSVTFTSQYLTYQTQPSKEPINSKPS